MEGFQYPQILPQKPADEWCLTLSWQGEKFEHLQQMASISIWLSAVLPISPSDVCRLSAQHGRTACQN